MPLVRTKGIDNGGGAQQEFNLVARHTDFNLVDQLGLDTITLWDIHSIQAARGCYNEAASNQGGS